MLNYKFSGYLVILIISFSYCCSKQTQGQDTARKNYPEIGGMNHIPSNRQKIPKAKILLFIYVYKNKVCKFKRGHDFIPPDFQFLIRINWNIRAIGINIILKSK